MPKSEREETLTALTARILSAMLDELIMDATLQSHHEVARGRAVCQVCQTQCASVHTPGDASTSAGPGLSRAQTPSSSSGSTDKPLANGNVGTGTSTPTSTKIDSNGNSYLECVSCSRQIASNRYAPHLSNCMGLSTARRGAVRGNTKSKQASDTGRSDSPASDAGNVSDEKGNGKGKAKAKGKKGDESDFTLKRKRPVSPQVSPNKKTKKGKVSASPVSRVKSDPDVSGRPTNSHYSPSTTSHSKIPSKLRDSSTTSFLERSSSSRESSPGGVSVPTPASSFSSQSPTRPRAENSRGRPLAMGTGPPKRPSPARPQPVHMPYSMDIDEGDETGSSTETEDSS